MKLSKRLKYQFLLTLSPFIGLAVRLLGRSIRWKRRYDFYKDRKKIYALWHGHALALALFGMDRGIYTVASRFADGDVATKILHILGFNVLRGSSEEGKASKGGRTVTLQLIDVLNRGYNVAITVDGPKGPPFKVKKGVIFLAQKTGASIVPAVAKFSRAKILNSWDRFVIPLPFSEGEVLIGEEIKVSEEDNVEEKRALLERKLLELYRSAYDLKTL